MKKIFICLMICLFVSCASKPTYYIEGNYLIAEYNFPEGRFFGICGGQIPKINNYREVEWVIPKLEKILNKYDFVYSIDENLYYIKDSSGKIFCWVADE